MKRLRRWLAHHRVDSLIHECIGHARACRCVGITPCPHWDSLQDLLSDAYDQLAKASR